MRILVTGARGMLGTDLVCVLEEKEHEVFACDIEELDITDRDFLTRMVGDIRPDVVVNCAAYTDVDRAEDEPKKAFLLNETGVENLALACRKWDVELCHISTDYVFDGTKNGPYKPDDPPNPINVYGRSKLAGEKSIRELMKKFYIIRSSWMYGRYGKNFVYKILELAENQKRIRVVDDQRGSPTWAVTLSRMIAKIVQTKAYGIYHVTDKTENGISWYRFGKEVVKLAGLRSEVIPVKTEEFPLPAKRPKNSTLDLATTKLILKEDLPFWAKSLQKFLHELLID